ncbi:MAG: orotidine 5'-phosphate decarboxylase [Verrucomicrobia bacterium]|nr:orotidine 5'-phosphate decarboxylase [Verrucomicrobiota bacterium]MBU1735538.1 orotidine 5'-phosphate decarboxylase [Verrucomicrobiota bacterium]MBU1858005.1 orotidine 5'-phosphate decarboxylase [Verrucomicrobiota bacterium]
MQADSKVYTQVSLDVTTIAEALPLAAGAVRAGIDWLEAGTPLILGEGLHAVRALRKAFPKHPIVADLKTMDGAGLEAEMMLKAGATHVVVMSQAHWASIKEMVKMAKDIGGQVMADVLNAPDKVATARQMQALGVDWIIVHTGYDERRYVQGVSPLNDLPAVLKAVSIPVQAVGGLTIEQALESIQMGARSLVIGAPLAIQADRFAAGDEFENILHEVVRKVREVSL